MTPGGWSGIRGLFDLRSLSTRRDLSMVGERKSPRMREQVLELYRRGVGKRKIALALGISKNTVKGVIRGDESGSSEALVGEGNAAWERQVYWEKVQADLGKKYVTIKSLHAEFASDGVQYLR